MIDSFCYGQSVVNVINTSGGKDSLAQWLLAIDAGTNNLVVFADTGHEHPQTYEYINYPEQQLGPVRRVKADFSARIEGKRQFIATHWPRTLISECGMTEQQAEERIKEALSILKPIGIPFLDLCMLKGRFPSTKARFCTFDLKHIPIRDQVILPLLREYDEVISWQGVRAQESPQRALLASKEIDVDNTPGLSIYRPILKWTHDEVFAFAKSKGIKPNPLYQQGCSRVGCMPCIHARKSELAEIFSRFPEEIKRVAAWERLVAACSRYGNSTFFPSFQDPRKVERRIKFVTIESHGVETYR
ncbi:phosphoadenosine phosphosulfate reductase domain-containing protein, partial [Limnobaculum xujianqingii]|uniref:phosphoadenosine phosphosulfate reductase domain-containing protein n=1 Tax=Limnobaculum xujianqingii TaxID=2738837 RepID=UPI0015BC9D8E